MTGLAAGDDRLCLSIELTRFALAAGAPIAAAGARRIVRCGLP